MRSALLIATGVTTLLLSLPAQARETVRLAPSSKWVLDYADDNCRLGRSFGTGVHQINMVLDQFAPNDWFRVSFSGRVFTPKNLKSPAKPFIRFGPHEEPSEADGFAAIIGNLPAFLSGGSLRIAPYSEAERQAYEEAEREGKYYESESIGEARERAAIWIELNGLLRNADLILETGPLDKAFAALRQCSWDTVRSWGLDVEQQKTLSRKPKPRRLPSKWFSPNDYPEKMLKENQQAIVNFRLMIDEKGEPTACTIQRSTRPKDFDDLVCRLMMKRARFEPALDAQGNPVRSYYARSVTWRIQ